MKPSTTHHANVTIEEFDFAADCLSLEVVIFYDLSPYDPGVRYTKNGDGWPPSGGEVEDVMFRVDKASGATRDYSSAELVEIQKELDRRYDHGTPGNEKFREWIDEQCYQHAADQEGDERAEHVR